MRNYCFTLFTCFCFRLLRLWFVFLNSVSVLRFNFVFLGVFLFWDAYFVWGFGFFCFGFAFCPCVSVLGLFPPIFVVIVVVLWSFCFYRPPYIFGGPCI